ncbi:LmeA family phospholipid-binding protein [Polymorphospora rubra]|uniref:DUF2993 domain-containing protein n=1 Tax=Polymorphospora rubra TaxID=338584 RepID=A0A810N3M4_9ACTN|nr:DUF2993 domain-containing protein [Polymorphospora rubra]BCJ66105.1 hypothetical protein Prubr_31260 [Polymorphospora rubra]
MADSYPMQEVRPRRRRGRRLLIVAVILLLVLAGLLVVADRAAVGFAERTIAQQVSTEISRQNLQASQPQVSVGGFPFLTQVVAGRYESISILLRDVEGSVQGRSVSMPELDVNARDVTASIETLRSGQGDVLARTVEGTGTISYASVAAMIQRPGVTLTEEGGNLAVSAPLEFLGQQFTVHGTANLAVSEGQVQVRFEDLTAEGLPNVPAAQALVNAYARQISIDVPLPELPFELAVQEVRPLPEGLAITASAQNVPLNSTV